MFTGIIQEVGKVKEININGNPTLSVFSQKIYPLIEIGESVSVNGVCLSVLKKDRESLYFNLSQETLKKTNIKYLKPASSVNLERSLTLSTPLGGHLILGHVDGVSKVLSIRRIGSTKRIKLSLPSDLRKWAVEKGSIAVNGVSLTIAELERDYFEVELIPITREQTNLDFLKIGDLVNLEMDLIGKYLENFLKERKF
ncbi:MAG: riboflavin synthase [Candidatus Aminicenantia bacterium]